MAKILIKRGVQEAVERLTLSQGEFGLATDTGNLYIGAESGNIHVNPKVSTVGTADKLTTPRNISVAGDATAQAVAFDGSADVQLQLVLAAISGLDAGTYTKVTVNEKGQVTAGADLEVADLPTIPSTKVSGLGTAAAANTGAEAGNVPVIQEGGKLLESILPDLSGTYVPAGTTINGKALSGAVTIGAADVGAIPSTEKGAANGVAQLDESGKVPVSQLPSYVSDVIEGDTKDSFPETGEANKIYVAKDTNLTYRWSGSAYVEISQSLALGETSATAFAGDKGKIAYDHSQVTTGNPHNVTATEVGAAPAAHVMVVASGAGLGHIKPGVGMSVAEDGSLTIDTIDGGTFE